MLSENPQVAPLTPPAVAPALHAPKMIFKAFELKYKSLLQADRVAAPRSARMLPVGKFDQNSASTTKNGSI